LSKRDLTNQDTTARNFRLDGKVAAITGGGSGIGRAVAFKFAEQGAAIRILDVNETAALATCQRITDAGGNASFHLCDVTNQASVNAQFNEFFRSERVRILINNAGISHIGTVETTTSEDFDNVVRVNVTGFYNCMRAVVGHMKDNGGGVIVNMASIAGSSGLPERFAYSMSKGAVIAMTYSVARDYLGPTIFAATVFRPLGFTHPLSTTICRRPIPEAKKKCLRSWQERNRSAEWRNPPKSLLSPCSYVRTKPGSSPAWTIPSTAASSTSEASAWTCN
jgi:NAD(P)-dependent dehydrogenase (short-subunit alcohol dehydrogenase family)